MIYKTEKHEKKLIFTRNISIAIIIVGVILLLSEDFSSLWGALDSVIIPILGIVLLLTTLKNLKKISGSYIEFNDDEISFSSREHKNTTLKVNNLVGVNVKLKVIELKDSSENTYYIYLDDYTEYKDKKEIKENFKNIEKEIKTSCNQLKEK